MSTLPITRITLYKHGVGYFERRGPLSGEAARLSFAREAMDDVLKSLVAVDLGPGQVLGVDFETPEDRAALIARGSIHLSDSRSLLDLLRDLRGRQVRLVLAESKKGEVSLEGLVVGVDYEPEEPLRRAVVALYQPEGHQVRSVPVAELGRVDLLDEGAAADLGYFLRAAQSEEERRSAVVRLSPGEHELLVGYVAPAPAWRVSYRLLFEQDLSEAPPPSAPPPSPPSPSVLLQGWGLFDNQLDEDLVGVELALVAGMPVSFRYRLYEPRTPERPLVQDEERTVSGPIAFAAGQPPAPMMAMAAAPMMEMAADAVGGAAPRKRALRERISAAELEGSVQGAAGADERGALFAYTVEHPVSVARGQSAMVPIVSRRLPARRELLYNGAKLPAHPVASLRLANDTGLTLERGPATVLEDGAYAGEAVLPFTRAGAELIVAYAVELGIRVDEARSSERRFAGLRVEGEYALIEEHELLTTRYELTSGLDRPAEVTVEHRRQSGHELHETRPADEEGAGFARWRVPCPPNSRSSLAVVERRLVARHEQVRGISGAYLAELLKAGLLSAELARGLGAVLELYRQAAAAQGQLQQLAQEREGLFQQQRQIQGNLGPLGREGEEGALRQRYVAALGQIEDQLARLAERDGQLRAEVERLEDQARKRLKRLSRG